SSILGVASKPDPPRVIGLPVGEDDTQRRRGGGVNSVPMPISQIKMPQLGESVTEGTVDKWLKHEGDMVKRDEPLVEVVTDKVNAEIPSPFEGKLIKIAAGEGETVRVGAVIAQIETGPPSATPPAKDKEAGVAHTELPPEPAGGRAPQPAPHAADGGEHARLSPAVRMVRSLATSPHAWTLQEVDVTNLVRYREAEKESFKSRHGTVLTYLPFVAQVLCEALREFPWLNSSWTDDGVVLKRYINLGIAVSIPDGLIVPVVKDADKLGFTDLVRAINDLVDRARAKQLKTDDVQGGTFTLNNTGATGSIASQPIINQPQAAILTTESIVKRAVVIDDAIAVRHMMNMCLSFDHRIVDGMMAGQFLGQVRQRLEEWTAGS